MSPRRSSRARTTQPPNPPAHTNSSTSTNTLSRGERSARSNNRMPSPRDASVQRSESLDDADATAADSQPRRSKRGAEPEKDNPVQKQEDDQEFPEMEEEVTRCICGKADYPGPPASILDQIAQDDPTADNVGDFFIQCDKCQVWQHAGCMGLALADETLAPEHYYCENCRPEFHTIIRDSHGKPISSLYKPSHDHISTRSSSLSSGQSTKKDGRDRQNSASTKRRATMNSRGAYDEDEMLRRAIEESRGDVSQTGKRAREDDDDNEQNTKRQRTNSSSPSSLSKQSRSPSQAPDQDSGSRSGTNGALSAQKMRGVVARNYREKEMREQQREQAAAQRAEAASKRNARSERRRGDESPPPTPSLSPAKAAAQPTRKNNHNDPSPSQKSNINNLRKPGGRPTARRGRLGRNQYTRDQPNGDTNDNTPIRDTSHDPNGNSGSPPGGANGINGESGRSSKAKTHPARTSMNEMKRRVAAILEFVGRMQTERTPNVHGNSQLTSGSGSEKGANTPSGLTSHSASSSAASLPTAGLVSAIEAGLRGVEESGGGEVVMERGFEGMASGEMMESLTRELVGWQSVYGKYGEK